MFSFRRINILVFPIRFMKKTFLLAFVLLALLPLSLAVTCSDTGVTSFAQESAIVGNNLSLDINVSYKSSIVVYGVEVFYPDSKSIGSQSLSQTLSPPVLTAVVSSTTIPLSKTGAYFYRLKYYPLNFPSTFCVSQGSFTILPAKNTSTIPDTNIFAVFAVLMAAVALISFRKKRFF